jgi:hypothetical protein
MEYLKKSQSTEWDTPKIICKDQSDPLVHVYPRTKPKQAAGPSNLGLPFNAFAFLNLTIFPLME